jgi:protein dithiol:quinone oxidoreductase
LIVFARRGFGAIALVCSVALAVAVWMQHGAGVQPCPWCVLQRLEVVSIAALALAAFAFPWPVIVSRVFAAMIGMLAVLGAATALWQLLVASSQSSCDLTFADKFMAWTGLPERWPALFMPLGSCADAAVPLFGLPFELFSLGLFLVVFALGIVLARRPHLR